MKRIAIAVVCLFLLSTCTFAADKPKADANPAHQDKKFLLNYLKQTRQDFLESISNLSEAQWNYKASPERWSIAECAEHITLAENFIRDAYAKTMREPAASDEQKAKANIPDEKLIAMLTDPVRSSRRPSRSSPRRINGPRGARSDASSTNAVSKRSASPSPLPTPNCAVTWRSHPSARRSMATSSSN